MAIQKKALPTKSENKPEAAAQPTTTGKPSTEVGSSAAVTPSMTFSNC